MPSTMIVLSIGVAAALAGAVVAHLLQVKGIIGKRKDQKISNGEKKSSVESDILQKYIGYFALVPSFRASSKREATISAW